MNSKIIISFSLTLILLIFWSVFSIYKMLELSQLTQKMYEHPYRVSNATQSIQTNIVSIHRYMKDVFTAKNEDALNLAITRVLKNEEQAYFHYETVFKYYLGNPQDIQSSYQSFEEGKMIREEVISLIQDDKDEEAQYIMKHKGHAHLTRLNTQIEALILYAHNKAKLFLSNSIKSEKEAIEITLLLLFVLILSVIIIVIVLIKHINGLNQKREETIQLLYQAQSIANMGTWKYDINADILEWNDETYTIFEREITDKIKHECHFLKYIHEDDLEHVKSAYLAHLLENKPYLITHRIVTSSGIKYVEQKCKTFFDSEGKALVSHGIIQNVTDTITEKIELNKKLVYDELTQAYNRFFFNKNIDIIIKQINPLQQLGLVMIDIDFFKKVNDIHGHDIGDHLLKSLTNIVQSYIKSRERDYYIRWGGDEFILLLEVPNRKIFMSVLAKIQKEIRLHNFRGIQNITCSFGAVLYHENENIEDTIIRADKALYKAKENGRNRIEFL